MLSCEDNPKRNVADSYTVIQNRTLFDLASARLTARQYTVLLAMMAYVGKDGKCFPSRRELATRTGLDPCAISRITTSLVDAGWLKKTDGRGVSSCNYSIERWQSKGDGIHHLSDFKGDRIYHLKGDESDHLSDDKGDESDHLKGDRSYHLKGDRIRHPEQYQGIVSGKDKEKDLAQFAETESRSAEDHPPPPSPAEPSEAISEQKARFNREREKAEIFAGKGKQDDTDLREWKPTWQWVGWAKKTNPVLKSTEQILDETENWRSYMFAIRSHEDEPDVIKSCQSSWAGWMRKAKPKPAPASGRKIKYVIPEKKMTPEESKRNHDEVDKTFLTDAYLSKFAHARFKGREDVMERLKEELGLNGHNGEKAGSITQSQH